MSGRIDRIVTAGGTPSPPRVKPPGPEKGRRRVGAGRERHRARHIEEATRAAQFLPRSRQDRLRISLGDPEIGPDEAGAGEVLPIKRGAGGQLPPNRGVEPRGLASLTGPE